MATFSQNFTSTGLTTLTFSVPVAGVFPMDVKLTCPEISGGASANSQVVTTIKQNGTTRYTSNAGDTGSHIILNCAAFDVITMQLSSSAAVDTAAFNLIKAIVAFG